MSSDNKYDRQLRLWGSNGQKALMEAHILVINAGPTGTETLKNLVLPGVGRFTILDSAITEERDLGNNFFVTEEHIGRPRAQVTCELLLEMNPDVQGDFLVADLATQVADDPGYFSKFSLVIAAQTPIGPLSALARECWTRSIPLLICRSYGLLGYVRTQLREHSVVEAKPDNALQDLRIAAPWPELEAYCSAVDLAALDSKAHSHTPFVVLLVQAAAAWKAAHGGALPSTFAEKNAFKDSVKAMSRNLENEINFEEAVKEAYKAYTKPGLTVDVQALVQAAADQKLTADSTNFHVLLRALGDFVSAHNGVPPLAGDIPDMTSETDAYVELQKLYKGKAEADVAEVTRHVERHLKTLGRAAGSVSREDAALLCRNVHCLMSVTTRSLADEYEQGAGVTAEALASALEDPYEEAPAQTPALWYIALRAADAFQSRCGRFPGSDDSALAADAAALHAEVNSVVKSMGLSAVDHLSAAHSQEVARYGACEVHTTAAVVGGIASQEAVKVITHQYAPLNNTVIYNGIAGVMGVYEL